MNVVTALAQTPAVTVERFAHPAGVRHRDPERETARGHAVSFVEEGSYRLRVGRGFRRVGPQDVFAATPGLEFSCAHDDERPSDRCLTVRYSDAAVESLRSAGARASSAPLVALTNRRAFLRLELAADAGGDALRAESLAGALFFTLSAPAAARAPFRAGQLAWYAARVGRAKDTIAVHYAEPLSLSRLAREAGMSLYHFARVFGELEGETPHQHLVRVRLDAAARRLREGAAVTETAHAVGFGSPSHFTATFRRRFGVSPSTFARVPACS